MGSRKDRVAAQEKEYQAAKAKENKPKEEEQQGRQVIDSSTGAKVTPQKVIEASSGKKIDDPRIFNNVERDEPEERSRTIKEKLDNPQNFAQKALSVAASPKTTAVLAGTLAGVATYGAATGAFTSAAATEAAAAETISNGVISKTASKIMTDGTIGRLTRVTGFRSSVPTNPAMLKIFNAGGRVAANSKTLATKSKFLVKMVSTLKKPSVILGILGSGLYTSLFWAPNEKGDALTTLTIVQKAALQAGMYDKVLEIQDQLEQANDIAASLPVVGFIQAEIAKFKAAKVSGETYSEAAKRQMAKAQEEEANPQPSFEQLQNERAVQSQEDDIKKSKVYALRREGKNDEADELEKEILEELKGRTINDEQ